jgi:hypothetical protein
MSSNDLSAEVRQLKELLASAALAIFASAARLRRKGQIAESQILEGLAVELQDILNPPEGGNDYDERGNIMKKRKHLKKE